MKARYDDTTVTMITIGKIIRKGIALSIWSFVLFFLIGFAIQFFGGVK